MGAATSPGKLAKLPADRAVRKALVQDIRIQRAMDLVEKLPSFLTESNRAFKRPKFIRAGKPSTEMVYNMTDREMRKIEKTLAQGARAVEERYGRLRPLEPDETIYYSDTGNRLGPETVTVFDNPEHRRLIDSFESASFDLDREDFFYERHNRQLMKMLEDVVADNKTVGKIDPARIRRRYTSEGGEWFELDDDPRVGFGAKEVGGRRFINYGRGVQVDVDTGDLFDFKVDYDFKGNRTVPINNATGLPPQKYLDRFRRIQERLERNPSKHQSTRARMTPPAEARKPLPQKHSVADPVRQVDVGSPDRSIQGRMKQATQIRSNRPKPVMSLGGALGSALAGYLVGEAVNHARSKRNE